MSRSSAYESNVSGFLRSAPVSVTTPTPSSEMSQSKWRGAIAQMTPLGRLLDPEEVAFAVAFLAAPEAGAINGQTLILDGGGIQG